MPFDHNDHYHRLLLRRIPENCRRALDVGCGTGSFARELAGRGVEVDALDPAEAAIETARSLSLRSAHARQIRWQQADITDTALSPGTYDYIACLASIHHVPFGTVEKLREALSPGGVLVILGCYRESTFSDRLLSLAAVPANALCRAVTWIRESFGWKQDISRPSVTTRPLMTLPEISRSARGLLPDSTIRRLLLWRYLLVYRKPLQEGVSW
ncbi:class I SAM-dependent methyltransferase [Streptomyces clavuligerus]|uniref:Methyltransferase family protein n=1 Tax=Streptomyces clavuligerus TaxID=1901 RepID=B5GL49_STRCL|nr:class I SAM-dependent methyltransferase [Streptomyces clavuligerus]ANW18071.1 methyltransferase [Streptomyces clavuligerus]AXU12630.1 class I SAM-dependent methyltransferase [Streptomyces clavuligerus]EDY47045.1 methyltransferase type 12 [Streptomyces clavuligerus]EFG09348.1 Methyltransferase family protein [Streptomyces clavuligerus]MBY6302532.1 class I SAM-dependent methyltransferase [Streptomyces clavuligerus]